MGKMDEKELLVISIVSVLVSPFIIVATLPTIINGVLMGWAKEENSYEYDPKLDPNSSVNQPQVSETPVSKPTIGQGFDNPNKLDPNS
jgi:hypothetical protein